MYSVTNQPVTKPGQHVAEKGEGRITGQAAEPTRGRKHHEGKTTPTRAQHSQGGRTERQTEQKKGKGEDQEKEEGYKLTPGKRRVTYLTTPNNTTNANTD